MQAITVRPSRPGSAALSDIAEPAPSPGEALVETLAIGICGTDREIIAGNYGEAPPGADRLVLGHESLGRVLTAPAGSGLAAGDLVVGIVRRPDPVPCSKCAVGEWDMCRNGRYTEHGIKGLNGFGARRFVAPPQFLVKIDPALGESGVLLEPASIIAKAWEHIERIGNRAHWAPRRLAVLGGGPVGLLAAWMGTERGLDVHVLDRVISGPKPDAVRAIGATYHAGDVEGACSDSDVIIECTGASQLVLDAMRWTAPNGITCLAGLSSGGRAIPMNVGALDRSMVLENDVVFGSVNANRRHYEAASRSLAAADRGWLQRLITRRVPLAEWSDALTPRSDDIKTVIEFSRV